MSYKKLGILLSLSVLLGISLSGTKAFTQESDTEEPSIQFGEAASVGSCSIGDQLTGEDGRTISIGLNDFQAENGGRTKCVLRINTTIPGGFHVQNVDVLYQGEAIIDQPGKKATFSRSYSFSGGAFGQVAAPPKTTNFAESNPLFQEQDNLTAASVSACGGTGQLGINMVARASKQAALYIDSADLNASKVELHFDLVSCDS